MLCPEGAQLQSDVGSKDENNISKNSKVPVEEIGTSEINSYKNPKTWKKSITNFFRIQLRSSKSNDGDRASDNKDKFEEKEITTEQKWQSLGKVFRRQSFAEHWQKSPNQQGENSSPSKRHGVRKVISSYFGKSQKNSSENVDNENL